MDTFVAEPKVVKVDLPGFEEAWQMVAGQLRMEMRRADYEAWVAPLQPLGFYDGVYRLGGHNSYSIDWVESRLRSRIIGLLEGILNQPVQLRLSLIHSNKLPATDLHVLSQTLPSVSPMEGTLLSNETALSGAQLSSSDEADSGSAIRKKRASAPVGEGGSVRKIQLQRAYGSERARVVQPERGMFLTNYLFSNWLPLLGHSAFAAILAARSLCYWNPLTGELRNIIETDMSELARRANVSVRTIKDVLNSDLIKRYFLRYKVRRLMTPNGVRTAGILLQVRMDDPLTPEDQTTHNLLEEEHWYTLEIEEDEKQ